MQQNQPNLEEIHQRLLAIEHALKSRGITIDIKLPLATKESEEELSEEFEGLLEKRRSSNNYISHEEVKKRILSKK